MKDNRYVGALVLAPFLIFLFVGGQFLKYGLLLLSLGGMYEFYKVIKEKNLNAMSYIGYIMCILYYVFINGSNLNVNLAFYMIPIFTLIALVIPVINIKHNFIESACTIIPFIYVAIPFSFISIISYKENGLYLLWLIFIASWGCDTCAYYIGKAFGKKKLCPNVSPNKSVAGAIGGLLGASILCTLFGMFLINKGVNLDLYHFALMGLICGVFSQFGDLTASSIKRYVGVKDYSHLIPGHGGILDRFDSILFSSVIIYYYLTFIVSL